MNTQAIVAALALGAVLATTASAERLERAVSDVTPAVDARGGSRILFRWDPALAERDVAVRKAVLRFELAGTAVDRSLTLRVHPVTAPWVDGRGTVAYDEELWSHAELDLRRSGTAVIDVTNVVKEIVEEGLTTYGFLLQADAGTERGLTEGELARFGGLSSASIEMVWRKVPPRPRGVRGG